MKKRIAVTAGDPAGVGPELCLKLLAKSGAHSNVQLVVFGDGSVFRRVGERLGLRLPTIHTDLMTALESHPAIIDFGNELSHLKPGVIDAETGAAAYQYVEQAIQYAVSGEIDAIVTAPIHKEAWQLAGVAYPGHTEVLAQKTGTTRYCMMLTSEDITCSLVTAHVGLEEVASSLTTSSILNVIELSAQAMQRLRKNEVRMVVCGLNPHAGEHGLFGKGEEEKIIRPAVDQARSRGINVTGPLPPDTAFTPSVRRSTDCYICMYHDQGLIPLKALAFDTAVNVTLGLPIVRTSVDHGTALDIAWRGIASASQSPSSRRAGPVAGSQSRVIVRAECLFAFTK